MKKFLPFAAIVLLTGCTASKSQDLSAALENPLYAEQYYDAQVEYAVNLIINKDKLTEDAGMMEHIEAARLEGLKKAKAATDEQAKGKIGSVMSDLELAGGEVLLLDDKLFTGPEFLMTPGVDVHAYLSTVIDPRDAAFPDETAVDLGAVHGVFGATTYMVPVNASTDAYTFVLYDKALERIVGFAQLAGR